MTYYNYTYLATTLSKKLIELKCRLEDSVINILKPKTCFNVFSHVHKYIMYTNATMLSWVSTESVTKQHANIK